MIAFLKLFHKNSIQMSVNLNFNTIDIQNQNIRMLMSSNRLIQFNTMITIQILSKSRNKLITTKILIHNITTISNNTKMII